jgi:uncharacterized protein (DUF2252 family)
MMIRSALAVAAVSLGVAAPSAAAHPQPRGFGATYPLASSLCSRVAAGQTPNRLAADSTQISAACSTLSDSYQQALGTYQTAVAPIASQARATLTAVVAAAQTAEQTQSWTAYRAALAQALSSLAGLRSEERSAQQAYVTAIRAARRAFWTTVHALPGASSLPGDAGTPTIPTSPTVPTTASGV